LNIFIDMKYLHFAVIAADLLLAAAYLFRTSEAPEAVLWNNPGYRHESYVKSTDYDPSEWKQMGSQIEHGRVWPILVRRGVVWGRDYDDEPKEWLIAPSVIQKAWDECKAR
jgi:hypothetical protein